MTETDFLCLFRLSKTCVATTNKQEELQSLRGISVDRCLATRKLKVKTAISLGAVATKLLQLLKKELVVTDIEQSE